MVSYEIVADEAILIQVNSGEYFSLSRIGVEFWNMLDGEKSVSQHAAVIAERYAIDAETVTSDLLELAGVMEEKTLLEERA